MQHSRSSFLSALAASQPAAMALVRVADGAVIATALEGALRRTERRRGLLGRDSMPTGAALAIAPCNAVHTFFMRFPIDVAFVSRDGTVVKISRGVPAWRLTAAPRAYATIEFPSGAAARSGLAVGDVVAVAPAPAIDG